jgi:hypothetical protein
MRWEPDADNRARELLMDYAQELSQEAERLACRLKAGAVSPDYVDDAAFTIRIRRPARGWGDLLLAVGICMLGLAGGVLGIVLTAPTSVHLKLGWIDPVSIGIACAGFLLAGVGGALKVKAS